MPELTMRVTCPDCNNAILLDDADAGREVECPRCRGFITRPALDPAADFADDRPTTEWKGRGVTSLVLGLISVPGSICFGLGGFFGLIGFILGAISLRTRGRTPAIIGLLASTVGVVLSVAVWVFIVMLQDSFTRPTPPPAVDGAQPPFHGQF